MFSTAWDGVIICSGGIRGSDESDGPSQAETGNPWILRLACEEGKKGSRQLRGELRIVLGGFVARVAAKVAGLALKEQEDAGVDAYQRQYNNGAVGAMGKTDSKVVETGNEDKEQTSEDKVQNRRSGGQPRFLVLCATGTDLSVGVALALACKYYDDRGTCSAPISCSPMFP
jgi:hypothetical protein